MAENYRAFFEEIKNAPYPLTAKFFDLGEMKPEWVKALFENGIPLHSTKILQRAEDVIHATRSAKKEKRIDDSWWHHLPQYLKNPDAVFLDFTQKAPALLLIFYEKNGFAKKLTIQLNKTLKKKGDCFFNILRTGGIVNPQGLHGKNYVLLAGRAQSTKK